MTVVRSRLEVLAGTKITARLCGPNWTKVHTEFVSVAEVVTAVDGAFELDLKPQSAFKTPGTFYALNYGAYRRYISVPDTGPVYIDDIEIVPTSPTYVLPSQYVARSELGTPNGVATLGSDGKLTQSQRPPGGGGAETPDATALVKGKLQLAGDLGGTASAPTVPDLALKAATTYVDSEVSGLLTYVDTQLDAVDAVLDQKAFKPKVRKARVTSGNGSGDVPPDTAGGWQPFTPIGKLTIPASAGDHIVLSLAMLTQPSDSTFWDVVVIGSGQTEYLSSGSASPLVEGDPAFAPFVSVRPFSYTGWLDVQAGHLVSGNVEFQMAVKSNNTGKIFLNTNAPFRWHATNFGQVA